MADFFEGKVAIVTGGSRGIGEATVRKLARRGAKVAVNYSSSKDEAEAIASEIGDNAIAIHADLSQGQAGKLAEGTLNHWGRIDLLVNNAGTTKFANHEDLDALEADDFLSIYRLNVVAAYEMIRAVAPAMKQAGSGSVVNVASIAGTHGIGSSVAYAASKGAMITMTKSLARALAPEIRINAVCPGYVGTGWFADRLGEEGLKALNESIATKVPLAHAGQAEDVADGIVMFLDDASRLVTGETLLLDAGAHLDLRMSRRPGFEI
ncbi:MAG: glucose 1-dehydrogenase [Parasphingopyxis sp.]|uniref:SDR family NAD(P)-dependent oxidoreductase n=1 Tax=Parasphingopyxis sp. TaxID=1920299 RepID=UPI00262E244E|nr:glucose 1-dehydrogenase [uncultured Parasphingopyxis sp.]